MLASLFASVFFLLVASNFPILSELSERTSKSSDHLYLSINKLFSKKLVNFYKASLFHHTGKKNETKRPHLKSFELHIN